METERQDGVIKLAMLDRTLEFQGELVESATMETAEQQRWTELELYRVTDGTGRYVLYVLGRSVVYHVHDGACNTGTPMKVRDLDEDAEPCKECHPDGLEMDALVDRETDRSSAYVCETVAEVLDHLRSRRAPDRFTAPGLKLLEKVVAVDEVFARAMRTVERL